MSYDIPVNYGVCKHESVTFQNLKQIFYCSTCLFCDLLQIAQSRSCILHMYRGEYLINLKAENYVRFQFLFVCKICLVLLKLFPANTK